MIIVSLAFEHFAKLQDRRGRLVFGFVNPTGKGVDQLMAIPIVDKGGKRKWLLPKEVHHVFQIIGGFFDEALQVVERILFVATFALEKGRDKRYRKLRFSHRSRETKRQNRVDESIGISNADVALSAEATHLE